jgi:tetratricopeptide (TPR) repeat protein
MGRGIFRILVLAGTLIVSASAALAAEELFDTKAAAQHKEKGVALLQQKNYRAAVKEFEEASTIEPDAEAFYYLGYAYYMDAKTTDNEQSRKLSMENFQKAYDIDPNYTPTKLGAVETPPPASKKPAPQKTEEGTTGEPAEAPSDQTAPAQQPAQ